MRLIIEARIEDAEAETAADEATILAVLGDGIAVLPSWV